MLTETQTEKINTTVESRVQKMVSLIKLLQDDLEILLEDEYRRTLFY